MRRFLEKFSDVGKLWLFSGVLILFTGWISAYLCDSSLRALKSSFTERVEVLVETAVAQSNTASRRQALNKLDFQTLVPSNNPDVSFIQILDHQGKRLYGYHDKAYPSLIDEFVRRDGVNWDVSQYLLVKHPLELQGQPPMLLMMGINKNRFHHQVAGALWPIFISGGLLVLSIILGAVYIGRYFTMPIQAFSRQIEAYDLHQNNTLDIALEESGQDEVTEFARTFNRFTASLSLKLEESKHYQNYLEAFFRLSPIPILITDPSGRIEKANKNAAAFFEMDMEALLAINFEKLIGRNDFQILKNHVLKSRGDIEGYFTALSTQRGIKKIAELNLSLLYDDTRRLKSLIITIIDVTERTQTQHEILENQTRLANINKELRHKKNQLEVANEKNKKNARKLDRLIKISHEITRCNSIEELLDVLIYSGKELLEARECIVFTENMAPDVLVPAKTHPNDLLERLQPVTENEGVVWSSFKHKKPYLLSDNALQSLDYKELGITEKERLCLIAVPISDQERCYGVIVYLQQRQNMFSLEDLHLITMLANQTAITLDKLYLLQELREKALHLEKVNDDLKRSQQQVVQLQKMESLGTLVGGIAHDFNNILGIITPNIDLLIMSAGKNQAVCKRAGIIQEAAERAAELTRQLLTFSRNQTIHLKPLSLNQFIPKLVKMLKRTLGKHIEIRLNLAGQLPNINADDTRLTQVIVNLAVNARDAMKEGGTLCFETALEVYQPSEPLHEGPKKDKYVRVSVSDTGTGIAKEHLDKIFDPFFTTKKVGEGTGLGLSVVYGIIKSHNGFIEIETQENKGTAFHLYFKPCYEAARKELKTTTIEYAADSEKILVVDDEEMIRKSLRDSLESLGYRVAIAGDGPEAVRIVQQDQHIDLAVVDLSMPQMNGIETIREMRKIKPDIKILLSSGYADQQQMNYQKEEIEGFLSKPYHIKDLAQQIKHILTQKLVSSN